MNHHAILAAALWLAACGSPAGQKEETRQPTAQQQALTDEGWEAVTPEDDISERYGLKPVYGIQDNYFDITIGKGCAVAVKIIDLATDRCIRYAYVPEGGTSTVQEIPQGTYYLKLAYGRDWMELATDSCAIGKFTRDVSYERSDDTFDFGRKNQQQAVCCQLFINVKNVRACNSFRTSPISEEEFMR